MKKLLTGLMAVSFAAGLGMSAACFADKHMSKAIAKTCKDKKPGDTVKVDGKDMKCPDPKWKIRQEITLTIEHRMADRRDTPKARFGHALFTSDLRFDASLQPSQRMPGRHETQLSIERYFAVGHITPRCAGSAKEREIWLLGAMLDQDTGMLELEIEIAPEESGDNGFWICDGRRDQVHIDVFSDLGEGGPYSMPATTGSRRQFTIPRSDGVDETLTVTVKAGVGGR